MAKLADYLRLLLPEQRAQWSIGIYVGSSPFTLAPHPLLNTRPALTASSLGRLKADGVADPFMVRYGDTWCMFFEIENRMTGKGEIGLATSRDTVSWQFKGVVLKEPFHLSYPHVFEHEGSFYMLPECAASGAVRLYKAEAFPLQWKFYTELLRGDIVDATPFRHAERWWIIGLDGFRRRDAMVIYHADQLEGPWIAHAANPITTNNRRNARPAGRMLAYDGKLIRLAQDYETAYGRSVSAFSVEELSPDRYLERPINEDETLLQPAGSGWNASGMHHIDACQTENGQWIACVDGRRTVWKWPVLDRFAARLHTDEK